MMVLLCSCDEVQMKFRLQVKALVAVSTVIAGGAYSQASAQDPIGYIDAHPPFESNYSCSEHAAGLDWALGDVAGTCLL